MITFTRIENHYKGLKIKARGEIWLLLMRIGGKDSSG
jgi:hypothetical protein